jgi:hypothetical protein
VEPPADRDRTAARRPTSEFGSATSALRAVVMTTAVAAMVVAAAVVDGNAA